MKKSRDIIGGIFIMMPAIIILVLLGTLFLILKTM